MMGHNGYLNQSLCTGKGYIGKSDRLPLDDFQEWYPLLLGTYHLIRMFLSYLLPCNFSTCSTAIKHIKEIRTSRKDI